MAALVGKVQFSPGRNLIYIYRTHVQGIGQIKLKFKQMETLPASLAASSPHHNEFPVRLNKYLLRRVFRKKRHNSFLRFSPPSTICDLFFWGGGRARWVKSKTVCKSVWSAGTLANQGSGRGEPSSKILFFWLVSWQQKFVLKFLLRVPKKMTIRKPLKAKFVNGHTIKKLSLKLVRLRYHTYQDWT